MENLVSIDTLLGEIAPYIPGAPNATIRSIAKTVLREFFNDSGAWIVELPLVDSVASQGVYDLEAEDGSKLLYVLGIGFKNDSGYSFLRSVSEFQMAGADLSSEGTPMVFNGFTNPLGRVRLYPAPSETVVGAIKAYVALTIPDDWTDELPESIITAWGGVIIDGIVGRAANIQDKPWTNPLLAQYHNRRFRSGIARAREVVRRQYTPVDSPAIIPRWA